ncbi:hypothetical protein LINPERPRIM_LOCUS2103, partial [Linum perenne]
MISLDWVSESVRIAEDIVKELEGIDLVEDDFEHFHHHW